MTSVTRAQLSAVAPRDPALVQAFEELFRAAESGGTDVASLLAQMICARCEIAALRAQVTEIEKRMDDAEVARPIIAAPPRCECFMPAEVAGWSGTHQIGTHFLTFWNGILTRLGT